MTAVREMARRARGLKQRSGPQQQSNMKLGDLEFHILTDGTFRLDGGAMFGVIPRPMWERVAPPDERNRILLAMNSLLIRAAGRSILVETGAGDKWDAKRATSTPSRARACRSNWRRTACVRSRWTSW